MVTVTFNGHDECLDSIEEFGAALDRLDAHPKFELWLNAESGVAMSMLRNGEHAFLMYLRFEGDSRFVSRGSETGDPVRYTLSNGQVDEYPRSCCVPIETCYQALAYFFVNGGMRPEWVAWVESSEQ